MKKKKETLKETKKRELKECRELLYNRKELTKEDYGRISNNIRRSMCANLKVFIGPRLRKRHINDKLRKYILKRDNYQCTFCHLKEKLELHHLIPMQKCSHLLNFHFNLITVCKNCHNILHKMYFMVERDIFNCRKKAINEILKGI